VVIEGDKIAAIEAGADVTAADGTRVLYLHGYSLIPGIGDMHNQPSIPPGESRPIARGRIFFFRCNQISILFFWIILPAIRSCEGRTLSFVWMRGGRLLHPNDESNRNFESKFEKENNMSSTRQKTAARRNIKKAAAAAKRKRTIADLPKSVRGALGKQASSVARKKR